ncbi:MAG: hypothetical protein CMB24_01770 [Euryarchaeota archaeon]|nr:hypothetical protein [Euryarchaeota archaeon]|tara:strand:+ start:2653 stop:2985 length:333 start_codon:yes stop_codon:yes gene_type:complete
MNLPPSENINLDAARLNEQGPSSTQQNQALQQAAQTEVTRSETTNAGNIANMQEIAMRAAERARTEDLKGAQLIDYYTSTLQDATNTGQHRRELAEFTAQYPDAIRRLIS